MWITFWHNQMIQHPAWNVFPLCCRISLREASVNKANNHFKQSRCLWPRTCCTPCPRRRFASASWRGLSSTQTPSSWTSSVQDVTRSPPFSATLKLVWSHFEAFFKLLFWKHHIKQAFFYQQFSPNSRLPNSYLKSRFFSLFLFDLNSMDSCQSSRIPLSFVGISLLNSRSRKICNAYWRKIGESLKF